jgi:hypothetical protein
MFQVTFRVGGINYTNSQTIANTIYSISEFITVVNNIIKSAYNLTGLPTNTPPYIIYHEDRFCLIVPTQIISSNIIMIVSSDLYYYIGGFPAKPSTILPGQYELYLNQAIYYLSPIYDVNGAPVNSSVSGLTQYNLYMIRSEFHTGSRFNDIQNIIVTTNIPIRQEMLPQISNPDSKVCTGVIEDERQAVLFKVNNFLRYSRSYNTFCSFAFSFTMSLDCLYGWMKT